MRNTARALATGPERYQALQRASECLARIKTPAELAIAKTTTEEKPTDKTEGTTADTTKMPDEDVIVPDLSVFSGSGEMKAVLAHAGLKSGFGMAPGDPPKDKPFNWFAGQSLPPGAKAKRGDTVVILAYQQPSAPSDGGQPEKPLPPVEAAKPGTMPNFIGLTLEQASTRLTAKMEIVGDEVGSKPPAPEKAYTIYSQSPAAGSAVPADKKTIVSVKRYGSAKTDEPANPPAAAGKDALGGKWTGKWAHWKGKATRADGFAMGDWGFSIRETAGGGFYYFMNGIPLDEVQIKPGNLTAKDFTETWIIGGGSDGNLKRQYFTYSMESREGKLIVEKIQHSVFTNGTTAKEIIVRAQLSPTAEDMSGWAGLVPEADIPAWIEGTKAKAKQ